MINGSNGQQSCLVDVIGKPAWYSRGLAGIFSGLDGSRQAEHSNTHHPGNHKHFATIIDGIPLEIAFLPVVQQTLISTNLKQNSSLDKGVYSDSDSFAVERENRG